MTRVHFTHNYLINPRHPVTVNVIGAGGTGSQVITCLGRLDATLLALGHPGLHVTVYDPDQVEIPNIGRQKFNESDLGLNKAECLISRVNAFFGTGWEAVPKKFPMRAKNATKDNLANIFITCTDNIKSRYELAGFLKAVAPAKDEQRVNYETPLYWMDLGNGQMTGQVIIGTIPEEIPQPKSEKFETVASMPCITDLSGYDDTKEDDSGPSCSHEEALSKQDLFINSTLAELGSTILWRMFRHGMIEYRGVFLNLNTLITNPVAV